MACVAVLVQALGIRFQLRSQRSASQGINRSWVGAVIKEVVEWSFHSTSIHGWSRLRLCRVLSSETGEKAGMRRFTRHSPELGIVAENMYRCLWSWVVCVAVTLAVSAFTAPKPPAELTGLV